MPAAISAGVDVFAQYDVILKAGFEPVSSILALQRSVEVNWDSYVGVAHPFFGVMIVLPGIFNVFRRRGWPSVIVQFPRSYFPFPVWN